MIMIMMMIIIIK